MNFLFKLFDVFLLDYYQFLKKVEKKKVAKKKNLMCQSGYPVNSARMGKFFAHDLAPT